ncbi:MAG: NAD-dependent epimerase/dehydratase family protein [Candidatus Eisenbacteria bacterium]
MSSKADRPFEPPEPSYALDPTFDAPIAGLRALVIGATGMIGAHAARALLARGVSVRALVRPTSRAENLEGLEVERVSGDLHQEDTLRRALEDCHLLVHAAAPYPRSHFRADRQTAEAVTSVRNVLEAAKSRLHPALSSEPSKGAKDAPATLLELKSLAPGTDASTLLRMVYVSSLTTIGPAPAGRDVRFGRPVATEDDAWSPAIDGSPYFRMKAAMEAEVMAEAARGFPVVVVNPSLCVDTLDVTPTTAQLLEGVREGRLAFGLPGVVDAVATRDVAIGIARALAVGTPGRRYILGGESLPTTEFLTRIATIAGVRPPRGELPLALLEAVGWATEIWNLIARRPWPLLPLSSVRMLRHAQPLDTGRARRELGLPHTPLEVAIRDCFAWLDGRRCR